MPLQDPVAIFTAASNARAQILCRVLMQSGIEAHVIEDFSLVGLWMGGTLPGIHSPKIWVDRVNAERAAGILQEHEQREARLRLEPSPNYSLEVTCEECGQPSRFAAAQRGSVQECPHCRSYVDVPDEETPEAPEYTDE